MEQHKERGRSAPLSELFLKPLIHWLTLLWIHHPVLWTGLALASLPAAIAMGTNSTWANTSSSHSHVEPNPIIHFALRFFFSLRFLNVVCFCIFCGLPQQTTCWLSYFCLVGTFADDFLGCFLLAGFQRFITKKMKDESVCPALARTLLVMQGQKHPQVWNPLIFCHDVKIGGHRQETLQGLKSENPPDFTGCFVVWIKMTGHSCSFKFVCV